MTEQLTPEQRAMGIVHALESYCARIDPPPCLRVTPGNGAKLVEDIACGIRAAVEAERERCAAICDKQANYRRTCEQSAKRYRAEMSQYHAAGAACEAQYLATLIRGKDAADEPIGQDERREN